MELPLGVSTFASRLTTQKIVFLLKALGCPEADFSYGTHIRGVYSPNLAVEYYDWGELQPATANHLANQPWIGKALEALQLGNDGLEAATTVLQIVERNPGIHESLVQSHLSIVKPHVIHTFPRAWQYLKDNGLLTQRQGGWATTARSR